MTALGILFRHGMRERLANSNRLFLAGAVVVVPLVVRGFEHGAGALPGSTTALWLALILGAGLVGQDTASGVLQLVLARPVVRLHYILARWMAAAALAAGVAVAQTVVIALAMAVRGGPPPMGELAAAVIGQASLAVGVTAVLAAFSTMVAGLGDIRFWVLGLVLGQLVQVVGQAKQLPWLARTGAELVAVMMPELSAAGGGWWYPLLRWASTVVAAIAVSAAVLNRKELSYGAA